MDIFGSPTSSQSDSSGLILAKLRVFAYPIIIALLVLSLAGIVVTSIYSSKQADVAANQNRAVEQQGAQVQEMTKALLEYQRDLVDGKTGAASLAEIKLKSERFQTIYNGLERGATVKQAGGETVVIEKLVDPEQVKSLKNIGAMWTPLLEKVKLASADGATPAVVDAAVSASREQCAKLSSSSDKLSTSVSHNHSANLQWLKIGRAILIGLGSISLFLLPAWYLLNRAGKQQRIAQAALSTLEETHGELSNLGFAKAEIDRIMETVQEGLFLMDENGTIGGYYSSELPRILRQDQLTGLSLYGILQRHLSDKMYSASRDFFTLLFDSSRKEKTVLKVNPLTDIEVNFPDPNGGFITRFLGFTFRRIMVGEQVDRLFVSVRDVTGQVLLENKLRESEKNKERELGLLLSIIHLPQGELENFIVLAEKELETVTNALRAEDFAAAGGKQVVLRDQLQKVFTSVHNLNGNSALLRLTYFQKAAHAFETQIKKGLDKTSLTGDDFIAIVISQAALKADLVNLKELSSKLKNMGGVPAATGKAAAAQAVPTSAISEQLRQLVKTTAGELGKAANLNIDEFALHAFGHGRMDLVRDVLIQLSRNAVAHGVESKDARKAKGKKPTAELSIYALPSPAAGVMGLALRDDGQGLNLEKIRSRAEEVGLMDAGHQATQIELIQCIFEPSFSTADKVDLHAGRGVGMAIVKTKMVDEAGGCIEVVTSADQFCEFRLYLPI
jgi:two-component system, chemotaxis family, sensor kinase CheA